MTTRQAYLLRAFGYYQVKTQARSMDAPPIFRFWTQRSDMGRLVIELSPLLVLSMMTPDRRVLTRSVPGRIDMLDNAFVGTSPLPAAYQAIAVARWKLRVKPGRYSSPLFQRRLTRAESGFEHLCSVELGTDLVLRVRNPRSGDTYAQSYPGELDRLWSHLTVIDGTQASTAVQQAAGSSS